MLSTNAYLARCSSNAMWTDTINAGSRFMAQKHGYLAPVWSWRFWQVPQNNTIDAGAAHANELPYVRFLSLFALCPWRRS